MASFRHTPGTMGSRAKQAMNMVPCLPLTSYMTVAIISFPWVQCPHLSSGEVGLHPFTQQILIEHP